MLYDCWSSSLLCYKTCPVLWGSFVLRYANLFSYEKIISRLVIQQEVLSINSRTALTQEVYAEVMSILLLSLLGFECLELNGDIQFQGSLLIHPSEILQKR